LRYKTSGDGTQQITEPVSTTNQGQSLATMMGRNKSLEIGQPGYEKCGLCHPDAKSHCTEEPRIGGQAGAKGKKPFRTGRNYDYPAYAKAGYQLPCRDIEDKAAQAYKTYDEGSSGIPRPEMPGIEGKQRNGQPYPEKGESRGKVKGQHK
jgi:hypothetical protein